MAHFLTDWAEVQSQIELPTANENRKIIDVICVSDYPQAFYVHAKQPILTENTGWNYCLHLLLAQSRSGPEI